MQKVGLQSGNGSRIRHGNILADCQVCGCKAQWRQDSFKLLPVFRVDVFRAGLMVVSDFHHRSEPPTYPHLHILYLIGNTPFHFVSNDVRSFVREHF